MSTTRQQLLDLLPDYQRALTSEEIATQGVHPSHVWIVAEDTADCFWDEHAYPHCAACSTSSDACIFDSWPANDKDACQPCSDLVDGRYLDEDEGRS